MNVSENTELYRTYGAHPAGEGWSFRVYAPSAREAALAGDFNHWQPVPMERQGSDWVLTVSDARPGDCYKYVITGADGQVRAARMDRAPEPHPTSRSCPCPSKSRWERTTWWTCSIMPPPPKAYCRLIHVIQISKTKSAIVITVNRTPRTATCNT